MRVFPDIDVLKTCNLHRAFATSISHRSHVEGCGDVRALPFRSRTISYM
jgi:hypothetical protein